MTQGAMPPQDHASPSSMEGDLLYEVVDGQIVEKKPTGAYETLIGLFLNTCLDGFTRANNRGRAVSAMLFDLGARLSQQRPDVAYVSYDRWPRQRHVPRTHACTVAPELAVEMISPSNTFYESPSHIRVLNIQDELTEEPLLPRFCLGLSELLDVEATEA